MKHKSKRIYQSLLLIFCSSISLFSIINFLFLQNTEGYPGSSVGKSNDSISTLFGIIGENIPQENASNWHLFNTSGFLVTNVSTGSPAYKADIFAGDVLLELNNKFIKNKTDFENLLKHFQLRDRVNLTLYDPSSFSDKPFNQEVILVWDKKKEIQNSTLGNGPHDYYSNLNLGLEFLYPYRFFASVCSYAEDYLCIHDYPSLKVGVSYFGNSLKTVMDQNIISKNELAAFSLINKSVNANTGNLTYSYFNPKFGVLKGEEYLKKINDKTYFIDYESYANDAIFSKNSPLVENIIDSAKFFDTSRYYNSTYGISMLYPSSWKLTPGGDSIVFSPNDNNKIFFEINMSKASGSSNITSHSSDCTDSNDLIVRMNAEDRCPTIENILQSIMVINNSASQSANTTYKGHITHPFDIRYNSCWTAQDVNEINRGVDFSPNFCGSFDYETHFTISYWNEKENGKSLADASLDDLRFLNENYKEVEMDKTATEANPSNIKANATSVTYSYKDPYNNNEYTDWIFYGTDDHGTNYKIEYYSPYDKFLKYWSTVKDMTKSIQVVGPMSRADLPHGMRVAEGPLSTALDINKKLLYVLNSESKTISIINTTTDKPMKQIELMTNSSSLPPPFGLALNEAKNILYVTNPRFGISGLANNGILSVIKNASTVGEVRDLAVSGNPFEVAVNSKTGKIYVGDKSNHMVSVLNGSYYETAKLKLASRLGFESGGLGLAIDRNRNEIYAVDSGSGNVSLIDGDTDKVIGNITISKGSDMERENACLVDIAVDSEIDRAYVADANCNANNPESQKGRLFVIDTLDRKVIDNISLGALPSNVVVNPQSHRIYVTNQLNDSVTIVEPVFHTTTELKVGAAPFDVAVNPKTSRAYVSSEGTNSVTMIDENRKQVVHNIDFTVSPIKGGIITCGGLEYSMNNSHGLLLDKDICEARPKAGFSFDYWSGNVKDMSDQAPLEEPGSLQPFYSLPKTLGFGTDTGKLLVRSSGGLVANFRTLPAPIPTAYWAGLIGISISIFTGYIAPNIAQWINSVRQRKYMIKYYNKIEELPKDSNYLNGLNDLKKKITELYANGKISEKQHEILNEKISNLISQGALK